MNQRTTISIGIECDSRFLTSTYANQNHMVLLELLKSVEFKWGKKKLGMPHFKLSRHIPKFGVKWQRYMRCISTYIYCTVILWRR
jgi:hypothetical protein